MKLNAKLVFIRAWSQSFACSFQNFSKYDLRFNWAVIDALQINWYDFIWFLLFVAAHFGIEQKKRKNGTKKEARDINKRFTIMLDNMLHLTHFHIHIRMHTHTQRESIWNIAPIQSIHPVVVLCFSIEIKTIQQKNYGA